MSDEVNMIDDERHVTNERLLNGEQQIKRMVLTGVIATVSTVIAAAIIGSWVTFASFNEQLHELATWRREHSTMTDFISADARRLDVRVSDLEDFSRKGERFTKSMGDSLETRVRSVENAQVRIEARLDVIIDQIKKIGRTDGGP